MSEPNRQTQVLRYVLRWGDFQDRSTRGPRSRQTVLRSWESYLRYSGNRADHLGTGIDTRMVVTAIRTAIALIDNTGDECPT